jgi:hypothetical protein
MTDIQLQNLKINIFSQAKLYIEDMGQFAPFGATILDDAITPIGYYSNEEIIDSKNAVEIIKEQLSEKIKDNLINAGAIAYDVIIDIDVLNGESEKSDAMCLIISQDGFTWEETYYPYIISKGECIWK